MMKMTGAFAFALLTSHKRKANTTYSCSFQLISTKEIQINFSHAYQVDSLQVEEAVGRQSVFMIAFTEATIASSGGQRLENESHIATDDLTMLSPHGIVW